MLRLVHARASWLRTQTQRKGRGPSEILRRAMSHDNVDLVRRATEARNAGDPSVWVGLCDPDIVLVVAPMTGPEPGTYVGTAAVVQWYTEFFRPFGRSFRVELLETIAVGDSVIVVQRYVARGRSSGADVQAPNVVNVVTFRAGRVIRIDNTESREAALRLVGRAV
jgi:ketosteroid isomerase-like protein